MIQSKSDLHYYLDEDRKAYGKPVINFKARLLQWLFPDLNWQFMRVLRHIEYHQYQLGGGDSLSRIYHKLQYYRYSHLYAKYRAKTGIELNPNCAGAGLHVSHGKCVVSAIAHIGHHCKILSDVTIGGQGRYDVPGAPIIGNHVFIASGAKIIGPLSIADGVVIGANAVVTRDILEPNTTWAGIPARKVSDKGSAPYLRKYFTE